MSGPRGSARRPARWVSIGAGPRAAERRGARRVAIGAGPRAALLAVAVAATCWATCASAWAAGEVRLLPAEGAEQTLSLDALAAQQDVHERPYVVRDASGERTVTVTGIGLGALLDAAGVDPYTYKYAEIVRADGGAVLLSREQVTDPAAFPDGPPVIYEDAQGTHFLRPSGGPGDRNGADAITPAGGVLTVRLRRDLALSISVTASPRKTDPRKPVRFAATPSGAGAGAQLTYAWYFDDGRSAHGNRVTHRFAKPGSYDVVVTVTTRGDRVGASAVASVRVGPPPKGPDRKGGGHDASAAAPDHGPADGTPGGTSGAAGGSADGAPGGAAGSAGASAGGAPSPAGASPAAATPPPAAPATPAAAHEPSPAHAPATTRRRTPQPASSSGPLLQGTLLTTAPAAAPRPAAKTDGVRGARTGNPSTGSGFAIPPAAWELLALLVLAGGGWWLDMRRSSSPRSARRGRRAASRVLGVPAAVAPAHGGAVAANGIDDPWQQASGPVPGEGS